MSWIHHVAASAPEIFLFLAVAIGTLLGRVRIRGFAIGATACTLVVAVLLGLLGEFHIPPMLKSIFFGFFVFTIGYRAGPEFFASMSLQTLNQVVLALVVGATGAMSQLGLSEEALKQGQANIAAGYAVTYVCGYILVLLFVPLVAPRLMGINLKEEAAKLEAALSGGATGKVGNPLYRKFQARVPGFG